MEVYTLLLVVNKASLMFKSFACKGPSSLKTTGRILTVLAAFQSATLDGSRLAIDYLKLRCWWLIGILRIGLACADGSIGWAFPVSCRYAPERRIMANATCPLGR